MQLSMEPIPIPQFLNRLLALELPIQKRVFSEFEKRLDSIVEAHRQAGTLDEGIEKISADRVEKISETTVFTHAKTGATTKHVNLRLHEKQYPRTWDQIMDGREATHHKKVSFFAVNEVSGRVYAFTPANDKQLENGSVVPAYREIGPLSERIIPITDFRKNRNFRRIDDFSQAQPLWDADVSACPDMKARDLHLITGAILPVWDRLPQLNTKVYYLTTETGERMLGRVVPEHQLRDTLKRLGVDAQTQPAMTVGTILEYLRQGTHRFTLVNGWQLRRRRSSFGKMAGRYTEDRIEITGPLLEEFEAEIEPLGGATEQDSSWTQRFYLPWSEPALEQVLRYHPVADYTKLAKEAA